MIFKDHSESSIPADTAKATSFNDVLSVCRSAKKVCSNSVLDCLAYRTVQCMLLTVVDNIYKSDSEWCWEPNAANQLFVRDS